MRSSTRTSPSKSASELGGALAPTIPVSARLTPVVTTVRKLVIDESKAWRALLIDSDEPTVSLLASTESTEGAVMAYLTAAELHCALRERPVVQARAVAVPGIAERSASTVAKNEGMSLGTAKRRIRTAMQRLRVELNNEGRVS